MQGPVLIDIGRVSECCSNEALEVLHKADPPADDPGIWSPHESPMIQDLVEQFSAYGVEKIAAMRDELMQWLSGAKYVAGVVPKPGIPLFYPWASTQIKDTEAYLASRPVAEWKAEDWTALVDLLVQKHLPVDVLSSSAEELAVKSQALGAVQAAHGEIPVAAAAAMLPKLASTVSDFAKHAQLHEWQVGVLEYAKARGAENIVALTNGARGALKRVILDHQQAVFLGDKGATAHTLQTKLFDAFGTMNRDWRRIAVSEAGENLNQGVLAALKPGTKVRRSEVYASACAFCKKMDGKVVTVVPPDAPEKDGDSEVWVGKTNLGRSASPRKRVGGMLVERLPSERYWLAAGIFHPHCRGRWIVLTETTEKSAL